MAIISVSTTTGPTQVERWEMPPSPDAIRSPVPSGVIHFNGTEAIAALDAANQTSYSLICTLPGGHVYILKSFTLRFASDDLVNDFNDIGLCLYNIPTTSPVFNMVSPGAGVFLGNMAMKVWQPTSTTPKRILFGGRDTFNMYVADMSADASTAGDMNYDVQFYEFDVDQIDKYELNTPIPMVSATSF